MTEAEWLKCNEVYPLLSSLSEKTSDRKFKLFSIACCRRISHLIVDSVAQKLIDESERLADGLSPLSDITTFRGHQVDSKIASVAKAVTSACCEITLPELRSREGIGYVVAYYASCHAADAYSESVEPGWDGYAHYSVFGPEGFQRGEDAIKRESMAHLSILRDIFGNPFRPVTLNPSWLTPKVVSIANGIYSEKAFDRMPILADALQDAGCDNEEILNHCRQPGEHVRGCWALDLILSK